MVFTLYPQRACLNDVIGWVVADGVAGFNLENSCATSSISVTLQSKGKPETFEAREELKPERFEDTKRNPTEPILVQVKFGFD